jgi:hypothetical protein
MAVDARGGDRPDRSRAGSSTRARRRRPSALVIEGFHEAIVERFEQGFVREVIAGGLERRLEFVLG